MSKLRAFEPMGAVLDLKLDEMKFVQGNLLQPTKIFLHSLSLLGNISAEKKLSMLKMRALKPLWPLHM